MFRNLCGDSTLVNVIIATTKWSKEDFSIAVAHEKELREQDILFKPALEKQARLVRHNNTRESAHQIICSLFTNTPLPLQIQREMVEMRKALGQTTAGAELKLQLESAVEEFAEKLTVLDAQVDVAKKEGDTVSQRELEEEREAMSQQIRNLRLEAEKLMVDYHREKFWWRVLVGVGIFIATLVVFWLLGRIGDQTRVIELQEKVIERQGGTIDDHITAIEHQKNFIKYQSEQAEHERRMSGRFANFMGVGGTALGYAIRALALV